MHGTVIGATTKCTLEPIVYQPVDPITGDHLQPRFTERPVGGHEGFPVSGAPETSPSLLYDVPHSELRNANEFTVGDYIIYHQQLGIVTRVDHGITILLPDSTVVTPLEPIALEVPMRANSAGLVSLAHWDTGAIQDENYLWGSGSSSFPGQSVLADRASFDRTSRRFGSEKSLIQAYVLTTPVEEVRVQWLCPNVFSSALQDDTHLTEMFRASTLKADAVKCDFSRSPNQDSMVGNCTSLLSIGDRVRFHDESVAQKHPKYRRIPKHQTFGYDMNVFKIVSTKTEAIVQWQDGSCTTENATSLQVGYNWVRELCPGDLVALKDGIKTVDNPASARSGHVPRFLHSKGTMHLQQVGVIQTVESKEQTASVRWYKNSVVDLTHGGSVLNPGSTMGRLDDAVTPVSIYELATFPALNKYNGDLVVVAPASIDQSIMISPPMDDTTTRSNPFRPHSIVARAYWSMYLQRIKSAMMASDWFKNTTTIRKPPLSRRYSVHKEETTSPVDFFGQIVAMDTSGIITVRFPSASGCHDIQIPFERIMTVIDSSPVIPGEDGYSDEDDDLDSDRIGGGWVAEDESDDSLESDGYVHIRDGSLRLKLKDLEENMMNLPETAFGNSPPSSDNDAFFSADHPPMSTSQGPNEPSALRPPVPESPPPCFAVLEDLPPSDHRFINKKNSDTSADRARCIRDEFEILQNSLPSGIFVRSWESHMDLLRVMIIGPKGTPYEHAPFVFDIHLPSRYPYEFPTMYFHSWTSGQGPVNPNLYEDGLICLSILGTWPSRNPAENWSPGRSTLLQVLVSIMGLVLVNNPFFSKLLVCLLFFCLIFVLKPLPDEAGYEALAAENDRRIESSRYTEKVFLMTRKFILHALEHRVRGLEDVLDWHYRHSSSSSSSRPRLLRKVIEDALAMIEHHNCTSEQTGQGSEASAFCHRLSFGAVIVLRKHVEALEKMELDMAV